jgi:hypothetical protein
LTLGGLLKHLAWAEDSIFTTKLSGDPLGAPWDSSDWNGNEDWEFTSAADDTPEELYGTLSSEPSKQRGPFRDHVRATPSTKRVQSRGRRR